MRCPGQASGSTPQECGKRAAFTPILAGHLTPRYSVKMGGCPGCGARSGASAELCPVCGAELQPPVVLELDRPPPRPARASPPAPARGGTALSSSGPSYDDIDAPNRLLLWRVTRAPLVLLLAWFTASHLLFGAQWVFIDNVNLLFHEAGHFLFSWGGSILAALGGTLGQLMWPAGLAAYFWFVRRDRFAVAVCVWWFGENLIGVGRYMADAAFEELALIGGDVHDWNFLFGRWGLLSWGQELGGAFRIAGAVIMLGALAPLARWTAAPGASDLRRDADAARGVM